MESSSSLRTARGGGRVLRGRRGHGPHRCCGPWPLRRGLPRHLPALRAGRNL